MKDSLISNIFFILIKINILIHSSLNRIPRYLSFKLVFTNAVLRINLSNSKILILMKVYIEYNFLVYEKSLPRSEINLKANIVQIFFNTIF